MKKTASLILSLIIALSVFSGLDIAFADNVYDVSVNVKYCQSEARTILDMINKMRKGSDAWYWGVDNKTKIVCKNLSTLKYDYTLEKVAMQRAAEIALYYDHIRPDHTSCFTAYSDLNVRAYAMGENIAAGYTSASAVNDGWREDNDDYKGQGHRRNMLGSQYNSVGIACVYSGGCYYWVEEFGYCESVNTQSVAPNNSNTNVSVRLAESNITSKNITFSAAGIDVPVSESVKLPTAYADIGTKEYWNFNSSTIRVTPKWTYAIVDPSIAEVSGQYIIGKRIGKTAVYASALGQSKSVPVNVHCNHRWSSRIIKRATTKNDGEKIETCSICKQNKSVIIPRVEYISISRSEITYTGTVQRPRVTVTDRTGRTLEYNKDFKVSWSNFNSKDAGNYSVEITLIGDYADSRIRTYKIVPQTNVTPKLNRNTITCNGTVQRPSVTVTDVYGNALVYNKDFKVSYSNWNSKNIGRYTVTVTMMGNYSGQKTFPYYINPKPTSFKTSAQGGFKSQSRGFTLSWNKQSDITGYQIQYATRSDFKNAATVYGGNANATSKTITGRAGNTRYYVRIRTYKNINGSYFYSDWSTGNKSIVTR